MKPAAERFELVPMGARAPAGAAGCDGLVDGSAVHLSHWDGNATPPELKRDTSTEIAMAFARGGGRVDVAVNNHFDTDGALTVYALLRPDVALANEGLLVAAAEAGDFDEWPADERGLRLEAAVRRLAMLRSDRDAYARVVRELEGVLENLDAREDLWGEDWRALERAHGRLVKGDVEVSLDGEIATVVHPRGIGELRGAAIHRAVEHAARIARAPRPTRWLLAFGREDGAWDYRLELARYAWADTVVRPRLPSPGRNATAAALALALAVPASAFALKGDLGMTGILRTAAPIPFAPAAVSAALRARSTAPLPPRAEAT